MSDSQRPHGLQPTRLLHPWEFPGKSAGVGCHCLLRNRTEQFTFFSFGLQLLRKPRLTDKSETPSHIHAALFTEAKIQKQSKCPLIDSPIKRFPHHNSSQSFSVVNSGEKKTDEYGFSLSSPFPLVFTLNLAKVKKKSLFLVYVYRLHACVCVCVSFKDHLKTSSIFVGSAQLYYTVFAHSKYSYQKQPIC